MATHDAGVRLSGECGAELGPSLSHWRFAALFAAAGAMALSIQIYTLREYMVALGGDEAAVGLGLFAWLAGIALGAAMARLLAARWSRELAAVALGLLAASGFVEMLLARLGRRLVSVPTGELFALGPSLALALEVFVIPGLLVGVGFVTIAASATRSDQRASEAIGRLYVFEAVGSLVAGTLASLVLIPLMRPCAGLLLLLALGLAAATPAAWARLIGGRRSLALLAAVLLLVALSPVSTKIETATQRARFATQSQQGQLLDWDDTPYEHIALSRGDTHNLYANGVYVTSFPDVSEDESRAHQLMLLSPSSSRVLALGGIETGLLRFCLKHPVQRLDLVVLDRRAFELGVRHLGAAESESLSDPRVHVVFQDPRRYLASGVSQYD